MGRLARQPRPDMTDDLEGDGFGLDADPDHLCESNGEGACKHCGAEEPPPWPTTR
jgi:hypothetical protein